ncbi:MAG: hypothetical protein ACK5OC_17875 [Pirellula sp.]
MNALLSAASQLQVPGTVTIVASAWYGYRYGYYFPGYLQPGLGKRIALWAT